MLAVVAHGADADRPLRHLRVDPGWPEPVPARGWTTVTMRAAALNHHDLWTLRGVGVPTERFPLVLGTDAAGHDEDGNEVIVYPVVRNGHGSPDPVLDSGWKLLSADYHGTFADRVTVPRENLLPKPPELSFEEAACLPGAWLTAYRMLFEKAALAPGATILVQGAGGGVSTALVTLGRAAGHRMWVTGRTVEKRQRALELGADRAFASGASLPEPVDAVMETVGSATWDHSVRALRRGGRIVVAGATTGARPVLDLRVVFWRQLSIVGATLGTLDQLARLARFCVTAGIRPLVDRTLPLTQAPDGFSAMARGALFGNVVFTR